MGSGWERSWALEMERIPFRLLPSGSGAGASGYHGWPLLGKHPICYGSSFIYHLDLQSALKAGRHQEASQPGFTVKSGHE